MNIKWVVWCVKSHQQLMKMTDGGNNRTDKMSVGEFVVVDVQKYGKTNEQL